MSARAETAAETASAVPSAHCSPPKKRSDGIAPLSDRGCLPRGELYTAGAAQKHAAAGAAKAPRKTLRGAESSVWL